MANQQPTPFLSRDVLSVEVRNPDTVLFSGSAVSVSSKNSVGPFDVLPQHENFISLLNDKIVIFKDKHQKQEIPNTSAIIKAKQNKVTIFLGVETLSINQQTANTPTSSTVPTVGKTAPPGKPANTPSPEKTAEVKK